MDTAAFPEMPVLKIVPPERERRRGGVVWFFLAIAEKLQLAFGDSTESKLLIILGLLGALGLGFKAYAKKAPATARSATIFSKHEAGVVIKSKVEPNASGLAFLVTDYRRNPRDLRNRFVHSWRQDRGGAAMNGVRNGVQNGGMSWAEVINSARKSNMGAPAAAAVPPAAMEVRHLVGMRGGAIMSSKFSRANVVASQPSSASSTSSPSFAHGFGGGNTGGAGFAGGNASLGSNKPMARAFKWESLGSSIMGGQMPSWVSALMNVGRSAASGAGGGARNGAQAPGAVTAFPSGNPMSVTDAAQAAAAGTGTGKSRWVDYTKVAGMDTALTATGAGMEAQSNTLAKQWDGGSANDKGIMTSGGGDTAEIGSGTVPLIASVSEGTPITNANGSLPNTVAAPATMPIEVRRLAYVGAPSMFSQYLAEQGTRAMAPTP